MLIRIPVGRHNSVTTPVYTDTPVLPDIPAEPGTGDFQLPAASFSLSPRTLEAYASSRYSHPVTPINISVPDSDTDTVAGWFGNPTGDVAGETLVKRMTSAVTGAISSYFTAADRAGFFSRPFRIGYALRLTDGTHAAASAPMLLSPAVTAPLMIVREHGISGNTLQTLTEIISTPMALSVAMPAFTVPAALDGKVTHLDFYATRQTALLAGDEQVTAIRSSQYFGENVNVWSFRRMPEDLVREAALGDSAFRIIGSVPIKSATGGLNGLALPSELKNLSDWNNYPALGQDDVPDPENPERPYTHVNITTVPLDLNLPEEAKRIRGLSVRGIFPRCYGMTSAEVKGNDLSLKISLYGSHHRERWRLLAHAAGPHIRLLRGVRYRWLRVDITAPRDAVIDALTFEVTRG